MAVAVKLSEELVDRARKSAHMAHRSTPKQIELWAEAGRMVLENPDLPPAFLLDSLQGLKEAQVGMVEPYSGV